MFNSYAQCISTAETSDQQQKQQRQRQQQEKLTQSHSCRIVILAL